jgi:hypothetical protein
MWQLAVVLFLGSAMVQAAFAQADTDPPALVDFDISPTNVDVTEGPAEVILSGRWVDSPAGVSKVTYYFHAGQSGINPLTCVRSSPSTGDRFDGVWSCPPPDGVNMSRSRLD